MHSKPKPLLIILNGAAIVLLGYVAWLALRQPVLFDDSFMFLRYALHLREGLGVSWNPDGVHTGGMTSLAWFLVVLPLSFFPLAYGQPLAVGSLVIGLVGIAWLGRQVSRLAISAPLQQFWLIFPCIVLLLVSFPFFRANMLTGMDTMLSFTVNVALSCAIWGWFHSRESGQRRSACLVGLLGALAVITRPENGILALGAPVLAVFLLLPREGRKQRHSAQWMATPFTLVLAAYLLFYRIYFHAWLPLSFHIKAQHAYRGYVGAIHWIPEHYLAKFLFLVLPVLTFPLLCADWRTLRIAVTLLTPTALTFAYLETVTQIMGYDARYYVPFLAPVLVAAFWMTDLTLKFQLQRQLRQRLPRVAALAALLMLAFLLTWRPLDRWSQRRLTVAGYPAPQLVVPAKTPLPWRHGYELNRLLAIKVMQSLPSGSLIAASEVGFLGAAAPHIAIIDLAGLNDNETAWHGFSMDRLLRLKPLLIYFPHSDYTWQRQQMLCAPGVLNAYILIGGNAFNYDLAIRRDTSQQAALMQNIAQAFAEAYPGFVLHDYVASSIDCTSPVTTLLKAPALRSAAP